MWFWIVTFLVLFLGLFYSTYQFFRKPNPDYFSDFLGDKFWDKVDTGDLIFFSGTSFGERSVKFYSSSVWTHVGIVFRDLPRGDPQSKIYFAEADVGQRKRDGPRVILLSEKIRAFERRVGGQKTVVGWRRSNSHPRSPPEKIMDYVGKNLHKTMDTNMACWVFADRPDFWLYKYFRPDLMASAVKPTVFCSEFVAEFLISVGVLDSEKIGAWYSPGKLSTICMKGYEKLQIIRVPEFIAKQVQR